MKATSSRRTAVLNAVFTLLAGLGILTSLLGIGADVLLGGKPGFNLPQLLLTAAGLMLALVAFAFAVGGCAAASFSECEKTLGPKFGHYHDDPDCP